MPYTMKNLKKLEARCEKLPGHLVLRSFSGPRYRADEKFNYEQMETLANFIKFVQEYFKDDEASLAFLNKLKKPNTIGETQDEYIPKIYNHACTLVDDVKVKKSGVWDNLKRKLSFFSTNSNSIEMKNASKYNPDETSPLMPQ